jgi:hypothetical protein
MRISHTQLAACQSNPEAWARNRLNSSESFKMGMSYDRALRLSIHKFHSNLDSKAAHKYLEKVISTHQKKGKLLNIIKIGEVTENLRSYIAWFKASKTIVISSDFVLSDKSKEFLTLGGKVSRFDSLLEGGYRAVLFGIPNNRWEKELRFPLIQQLVSEMFARPVQEIEVGYQRLNGKDLQTIAFNPKEIDKAYSQFRTLSQLVHGYYSKPLPKN